MQIRKGQRGKERIGRGREGGRERAGIRPRVTDMVMVLYIQHPLYCPIAERGMTRGKKRKGGPWSRGHRFMTKTEGRGTD